ISLPIYVMISKSDVIEGFSAFWQAVPRDKRDQIFGWSSPYSIDAAFKETWLDDAMAGIRGRLNDLRLEQAASANSPSTPDAFLFPCSFDQLSDPLKQCLKHLLHVQAAEEVRPFRGLYFCGDPEGPRRNDQGMAAEFALEDLDETPEQAPIDVEARPGMVSELLSQKVFRERGLARPLASSLSVRNRQVRLAQAALVVLFIGAGLGLTAATFALRNSVEGLEPSLRDIRATVIALREREARAREAQAEELDDLRFFDERDTNRLLDAMGRFDTDSFGSVLMPTSLASDVNDQLAAFLSQGFDTVLMRAIYNQLRVRTERALAEAGEGRERQQSETAGDNAYADQIMRLHRFVAEMQMIDELSSLYNELAASQNLDHLDLLLTELFDTRMPRQVSEASHLVRTALAKVQFEEFDVEVYRDRATTRARQLTWDVHDALFKAGALEQELISLARRLSAFVTTDTGVDTTARQISGLYEDIANLSQLLQRPGFAWATTDEFDLGETYRTSIETIANTRFFLTELASDMREAGQSDFDRFRARLGAYAAPVFGPLLKQVDGRTQMAPADQLVGLAELIEELTGQRFMATPSARRLVTSAGTNGWLSWDPSELDRALTLYAGFDRYAAEDLDDFPEAVRPKLYDLSKARLAASISAVLAEAQLIESRSARSWAEPISGSDLERRVEGFAAAAPRLDRLIRILRQLEIDTTASSLQGIAVDQASSLLFELDTMLEQEPAYEPRHSLDRWNGATPAVTATYAFTDDLQAQAYLNYQRERLTYLTDTLARPLLDFLDRHDEGLSDTTRVTGERWRAIADELRRYDKRQANSAVAQLERFIRFDLGEIDVENCAEVKPTNGPLGPASVNYFADRMRYIKTMAYWRCADIVYADLVESYNAIAQDFDQRLAGRYPFGEGSIHGEADPGQISQFFDRHGNALQKLYRDLEAYSDDPITMKPQFDFINAMSAARRFFEPDARAEEAETESTGQYTYFLDARFRTLREREVFANHILDWRLEVGANRVIDAEDDGPLIWRVGDPINFKLRWAANAPRHPDPSSQQDREFLSIDGMTVRFSYDGNWALIRLLEDQRIEELESGLDLPFTLGFTIATTPSGTAPQILSDPVPGPNMLARGFWRLMVSTNKDGLSHIIQLPRFPAFAPAIASKTSTG
ncbi:MAG: type VI secretion system protein, partial [Pseudomonadota bacterium]